MNEKNGVVSDLAQQPLVRKYLNEAILKTMSQRKVDILEKIYGIGCERPMELPEIAKHYGRQIAQIRVLAKKAQAEYNFKVSPPSPETHIALLVLHGRSEKLLLEAGFSTVGQLTECTVEEILAIPGFGRSYLHELFSRQIEFKVRAKKEIHQPIDPQKRDIDTLVAAIHDLPVVQSEIIINTLINLLSSVKGNKRVDNLVVRLTTKISKY